MLEVAAIAVVGVNDAAVDVSPQPPEHEVDEVAAEPPELVGEFGCCNVADEVDEFAVAEPGACTAITGVAMLKIPMPD